MELRDKMEVENISNETLRQIAEIIGIDALFDILDLIGGNNFYFPKTESLTREIRNQQIINECNGFNFREVAKKYGLTTQWVQKLYSDYQEHGLNHQDGADTQLPEQFKFY